MVFFPVNLDITKRACLVIGGGSVALRKVIALIGCCSKVTVVSPEVVPELHELAVRGVITLHLRAYRRGDLQGAFLVFAATDNHYVQEQVSQEAKDLDILLNSADDPGRCDFQVPAKVRRGGLLLTISTGGASPALSKVIRKELEKHFGEEYCAITELFAGLREEIVQGPGSSVENKKLFDELISAGIVDQVKGKQWQRVRSTIKSILPCSIDAGVIVDKVEAQHS